MDFFTSMSEEYAQKHFPDGSVLDAASKSLKKRSVAGVIMIGLFAAASIWGLVWAVGKLIGYISSGEKDMLGVTIFFCVIFGLAAAGFVALLIFILKPARQKRSDYVAASAKQSKLPKSEIEAFDRQALASDCVILRLAEGLDRALSNATNSDGLLTRDYVYLADPAQTVLRVDGLAACCFTDYTYFVTVGNRQKKVHNLAVYLLSENGVSVRSDASEKAGQALIKLLQKRKPSIDVNDGKVLPEGDVDNYTKRILEERHRPE